MTGFSCFDLFKIELCPLGNVVVIVSFNIFTETLEEGAQLSVHNNFGHAVVNGPGCAADCALDNVFVEALSFEVLYFVARVFTCWTFHDLLPFNIEKRLVVVVCFSFLTTTLTKVYFYYK